MFCQCMFTSLNGDLKMSAMRKMMLVTRMRMFLKVNHRRIVCALKTNPLEISYVTKPMNCKAGPARMPYCLCWRSVCKKKDKKLAKQFIPAEVVSIQYYPCLLVFHCWPCQTKAEKDNSL